MVTDLPQPVFSDLIVSDVLKTSERATGSH